MCCRGVHVLPEIRRACATGSNPSVLGCFVCFFGVCVCEREREREGGIHKSKTWLCMDQSPETIVAEV